MNGLFIVLDGLDCVGKTTLAKLLAEKLDGIFYSTPPKPYLNECRQIDKNGVFFIESRFKFFIKTVKYASKEIEALVTSHKLVIVDRWIWTTFSYHFAANPELYLKYKDIWPDILSALYPPDLSVLLHIDDEQIWLQRMTERKPSECDNIIMERPKLRSDISRLFMRFNPNFQPVDNSGSIENSLQLISRLIVNCQSVQN